MVMVYGLYHCKPYIIEICINLIKNSWKSYLEGYWSANWSLSIKTTHTHAYTRTCTRAHTCTHAHAHTCTRVHTRTHAHMHTHAHVHTHTTMHAHTHTTMHAHTHTYTHTTMPPYSKCSTKVLKLQTFGCVDIHSTNRWVRLHTRRKMKCWLPAEYRCGLDAFSLMLGDTISGTTNKEHKHYLLVPHHNFSHSQQINFIRTVVSSDDSIVKVFCAICQICLLIVDIQL